MQNYDCDFGGHGDGDDTCKQALGYTTNTAVVANHVAAVLSLGSVFKNRKNNRGIWFA